MKNLKFLAIAFVAMLGFTACEKDCGHEFIEYDPSEALIGTWTVLEENQAEAMVINPDGTFEVTGVMQGGALYEEKGTIKVVNNKVSLTFEGDKEAVEGRLELVAGKSLSIVLNKEYDIHLTYDYCANDLSDEIVGMWVCNDSKADAQNDMMIETFDENGKTYLTGFLPMSNDNPEYVLNDEANYKVVGDLMFLEIPADKLGGNVPMYNVERMIYSPNGTGLGDILTFNNYTSTGAYKTESWLRIKQHLELEGKKYDYIKTYITNVKGLDKDIPFFGSTINFANLDSSALDKFLKATLFAVQFPNANTIEYSFLAQELTTLQAPISVEGNKMTVKMSANHIAYRDVEIYAFQDVDCSQFHMYMPTSTFKNFIGNMQVNQMWEAGQLNLDDAAAVKAVYDNIESAIETINVSLVMTK